MSWVGYTQRKRLAQAENFNRLACVAIYWIVGDVIIKPHLNRAVVCEHWPALILGLIFALVPLSTYFSGVPILIALVVFAIASGWSKWRLKREELIFLGLMLQYPLLHLMKLTILEPSEGLYAGASATHPTMWGGTLLLIPLSFFYSTRYDGLVNLFRKLAPFFILGVLIAQGAEYVLLDQCRVTLGAPNVFNVPLSLTYVAFLWIGTQRGKANASVVLVVSACIVSSAAFTQTRGIFLAQLLSFGLLIFASVLFKEYRYGRNIFVGLVLGLFAAFAIDVIFACGFAHRISVLFQTSEAITLSYRSANARLEMWSRAIDLIREAPVFGHSIAAEVDPAPGNHYHVHNMYLSWLIWGGGVSLASGLVFLFSLLLPAIQRGFSFSTVSVICGVPVLLGASMLFDSFLVWWNHHYVFIIYAMLGYRIIKESLDQDCDFKAGKKAHYVDQK